MAAISGGGERSQVEGSDQRWSGAIAGGGERSQAERSARRREGLQVEESDRKLWRANLR